GRNLPAAPTVGRGRGVRSLPGRVQPPIPYAGRRRARPRGGVSGRRLRTYLLRGRRGKDLAARPLDPKAGRAHPLDTDRAHRPLTRAPPEPHPPWASGLHPGRGTRPCNRTRPGAVCGGGGAYRGPQALAVRDRLSGGEGVLGEGPAGGPRLSPAETDSE